MDQVTILGTKSCDGWRGPRNSDRLRFSVWMSLFRRRPLHRPFINLFDMCLRTAYCVLEIIRDDRDRATDKTKSPPSWLSAVFSVFLLGDRKTLRLCWLSFLFILSFYFGFFLNRYLLNSHYLLTLLVWMGGVVSIRSHFMRWYFKNALTRNSSHWSEFEALVIMYFAMYME